MSSAAMAMTAAMAAAPVMRLGMIRWSRSISVIGTSAVTSSRPEDDAHGVVLRGDDRRVERAGRQLDERVARRDRRAAVVALAAQREPRDDGDVVGRAQLRAAARAARARMAQRLAPRQAVDDDVEERSDDQAADGGEGDGQGHGGHKLAAGADARAYHWPLLGQAPLLGVIAGPATAAEPLALVIMKLLELSDVAVMTYESAAEEVTTTVPGSFASRIGAGPVVPVPGALAVVLLIGEARLDLRDARCARRTSPRRPGPSCAGRGRSAGRWRRGCR